MKKSLIALAALAVVGAASAQSTVTIGGKLRYAFVNNSSTTAGTAIKATGLQRTDGDLVFTVVEDLGGGLKATANMAIQTGARSIAASNRDGNLSLAGGFGTVALGSIDAGNGILALGGAGASWLIGMDTLVIPDTGNIDYLSYTSPAFSGFNFRVLASDSATAVDAANSVTGFGMHSTTALQDSITYGVTYSAGPLKAAADVTTYGNNAITAATARADGRTRLSANYDLGVATVGLGYEMRDAKATATSAVVKSKDTLIGVLVPVGQFDFAVNYAQSKTDGVAFKVKGVDAGVRYNLSKRTYVALQLHDVDGINLVSAKAANNSGKITRLQLAHSF